MTTRVASFLAGAVLALSAGSAGVYAGDHGTHATKGKALVCPVMKGSVKDTTRAPRLVVNNQTVHFCCAGCPDMLRKDPAKYLKTSVKDPVTGKAFRVTARTPRLEHQGALFLFSSEKSLAAFRKNPAQYHKHARHA